MAGTQPASVRRLFSGNGHNPQVSTLAALADVLGHEIQLVPKSEEELAAAVEKATGAEDAAADLRSLGGVSSKTLSSMNR